MNNTNKQNNNTEDGNSLSEERQDVTCSEERTELSPSSGSPLDRLCEKYGITEDNLPDEETYNQIMDRLWKKYGDGTKREYFKFGF